MQKEGTIVYNMWTVAGDVRLKVHYGIFESQGILNLGFIEVVALDETSDTEFNKRLDREMEDIIQTCVQDYQTMKEQETKEILPRGLFMPTTAWILRVHPDYDFSIN